MKVGIVLYSQTGNTQRVIDDLRVKLEARGIQVEVHSILPATAADAQSRPEAAPPLDGSSSCQLWVVAAPVQGWAPAKPMTEFLKSAAFPAGSRAVLLVTQGFWFPWFGANQSISGLRKLCEERGLDVLDHGIVSWLGRGLEQRIHTVTQRLAQCLAAEINGK